MSYQSDSVRKMQLLAQLANQHHPFGKFLWGEFETLKCWKHEKAVQASLFSHGLFTWFNDSLKLFC